MFEIGSALREERHRRKLDLGDVASATRIRVSHLEALEQERFDQLPPGLYRRSFLREYADFLDLDGDAFAQEYDLRFAEPDPEPFRQLPPPGSSSSLAFIPGRRALLSLSAIALLGLVGAGVWLLNRGGNTTTPPLSAPTTPAAKTPPPAHDGAKPAGHTSQPAAVLTLTATRGTCWLQIQLGGANGHTIYSQTLQQGQTARFSLRRPLFIRMGAPWNINAAIAGHAVTATLPHHTGNILANTSGLKPIP